MPTPLRKGLLCWSYLIHSSDHGGIRAVGMTVLYKERGARCHLVHGLKDSVVKKN